jgi:hypothetical protein
VHARREAGVVDVAGEVAGDAQRCRARSVDGVRDCEIGRVIDD